MNEPRWFFGIISSAGIWATGSRPGEHVIISNYNCRQSMEPCWVAYLGPVPHIAEPKAVTCQDVVRCLDQYTLPPDPKSNYYPDEILADMVAKLFEVSSSIDNLRIKIRARVSPPA